MRPSSWNGVGAIAKVPAALAVSFDMVPRCFDALYCVIPGWSARTRPQMQLHIGEFRDSGFDASHRPGMTFISKPPRAHLDLFLGEENLLGMGDDILGRPVFT